MFLSLDSLRVSHKHINQDTTTDTSNDEGEERREGKYRIYSTYLFQKAYPFLETKKFGSDLSRNIDVYAVKHQKEKCETEYPTTNIKGFSHFHSFMLRHSGSGVKNIEKEPFFFTYP